VEKYGELRALTKQEIIDRIDAHAASVQFGPPQYLEELYRRDAEDQTTTIRRLTWLIAALTLINSAFVVFEVVRG
jgi:hypothetical protein